MLNLQTAPTIQISNVASVKPVKLSKLLIYLFRIYQIIFSVDLGFFEFKSLKIKFLWRFIAISQSFALGTFCLLSLFVTFNANATAIWYIAYMSQYFISVSIMHLISKDVTFYKFLNSLLDIDTQLNFQYFNRISIKMLVAIIFSITSTILSIFIYRCIYPENFFSYWIIQFIHMFPTFTLDSIYIFYFFIFYSVNCRLVALTTVLNKKFTNIVPCYILYKSIIENTLKVKSCFDIVVSIDTIIFHSFVCRSF